MKKHLIISVFTFLFIQLAKAEKIKGFYVTNNHDTIKALLKIPYNATFSIDFNFVKMQREMEYINDAGEKITFTPKDILAYGFEYYDEREEKDDTMLFVSKKNIFYKPTDFSDNDSTIFLMQLVKGKLNLYNYYSINSVSVGFNTSNNVQHSTPVLEFQNQIPFTYNSFKFKTEMAKYLADCPLVLQKIEEKNYKNKHLHIVVELYNGLCGH
ncbi:MAG: hypothetical protein U0U67_12230 [Chitinophagales bacterium]